MFTRKDYLAQSGTNGREAFRRYYGEIIDAAGGPEAFTSRLPVNIDKIRGALANGDEHLNTIPLGMWDMYAAPVSATVAAAMRERGDYPTLGNAVCVLKEAARRLAQDDA